MKNKEDKLIVTRVTFIQDHSDGTYSELKLIMPQQIARAFSSEIGMWREDWLADFNTFEKYQKAEKYFLSKEKKK